MGALLVEGWDIYGPAQGLVLGHLVEVNNSPTLESSGGSLNLNHVSMNTSSENLVIEFSGSDVNPVYVGIHFKVDALPASEVVFLTLTDLANIHLSQGNFGSDFQLALNTDGSLESKAGLDVSAGGVITAGTWHKLELMFENNTGSSFNGNLEVRVDGTQVMNLTNERWSTTASNITHMKLEGDTAVFRYDDLYVFDDSGSLANDFAGDFFVETLRPTADDTTDWSASGAGDNFEEVNETDPDFDTSFVASQTTNDVDLYEFGDLTGNVGTILALAPTIIARREVGSTQNVNMQLVGDTETVNLDNKNLGLTYTVQQSIRNEAVDDLTGAVQSTIANVNDLKAGVRIP